LHATAATLPDNIRLGTSSWSFPGWKDLVYDRKATQTELARHGLAAYAKHPLLRAAGIDRTFYGPMTSAELAENAESVPDSFRFLVKASGQVTTPWNRTSGPKPKFEKNELFLDAGFATNVVVCPFIEGLGAKGGPLVFQFTPLGRMLGKDPSRFIGRLHDFLTALPKGPWYAVEVRDPEVLNEEYVQALLDAGATHCLNVHARMPGVAQQAEVAAKTLTERVAVRWMLHAGMEYEEAKDRYAPFTKLVDEDPDSREAIAGISLKASRSGAEAIVIANNKAEGCAPETLRKLAEEIVRQSAS
jgi:uncharacterized protein YecE (DUF72 family)